MPTALRSFAKINIGLAIGPVRPDGFHSLTTVYQTLAMHDLVRVEARPAPRTEVELTTNHPRVPADETNTAWRAVTQALHALGRTAAVSIHIEKQLPVQGGLGAGSGNAVAAMLGLEAELRQMLPQTERLRIAAAVGSDVPLFLLGGAVLGLGRGEEVYPLADPPSVECVVAVPEIGISTPQAFRDWDARLNATASPKGLTSPTPPSRLEGLSRSIAAAWSEPYFSGVFSPLSAEGASPVRGADERKDLAESPLLALVHTGIANDFEEVVFPKHSQLRVVQRLLAGSSSGPDHREDGSLVASLSGSGAALFGLYRTREAAEAARRRVVKAGVFAIRTKILQREEYWRTMMVR